MKEINFLITFIDLRVWPIVGLLDITLILDIIVSNYKLIVVFMQKIAE